MIYWFIVFDVTFSNISAISWRPVLVVEEAREPPTMGKQLVSFITCGCESSVPFFIRPSLRRDVLWYTNVRLSVRPSHSNLSLANSLQISQSYWNWWSYFMVKFRIFIPELWDFIHQIVGDFSYVEL